MLLEHDLLVIDQLTSFARTDFSILDGDGNPVGSIVTEGSLSSRLFRGSREFSVIDASDGATVVRLVDVPNFGRDTFEVRAASGENLMTVARRFSWTGIKLRATASSGSEWTLDGNWREREFTVADASGAVLAQIGRSWKGAAAVLRGHERYTVTFTRRATDQDRRSVLGLVITIDLVRAKDDEAAAASAST